MVPRLVAVWPMLSVVPVSAAMVLDVFSVMAPDQVVAAPLPPRTSRASVGAGVARPVEDERLADGQARPQHLQGADVTAWSVLVPDVPLFCASTMPPSMKVWPP